LPAMYLQLEHQQLVQGKSKPSCTHQLAFHEVSYPKPKITQTTLLSATL